MPKKIISKRDVSPHPEWMRVEQWHVELANGRALKDFYVRLVRDCVIVIAKAPDGRIITLDEHATALGRRVFKFPSGITDDGEAPEAAARRELAEETGYSAESLKEVAVTYPSPENTIKPIHVFVATNTIHGKAHPEESEDIKIRLMTPKEVDEIAGNGGIEPSEQAAAWMAARKRFL